MAKKYENVEKITTLLDDEQLGGVQKRLVSTEKSLSGILKKLAALEVEKQEREAAEAVARAEQEARAVAEEAARIAAEEKAKAEAEAAAKAAAEEKAKKTAEEKEKAAKAAEEAANKPKKINYGGLPGTKPKKRK